MNTIFDFKRAGLLVQRHFIERFQGELMFWGVSMICMMFIRNEPSLLLGFVHIIYAVYTSLFFKEIHSPTNRINYFMIPATQFEKYMVSLLHTVVYCGVMIFTVHVAGNILGTWIHNLLANISFLVDIFHFRHHDLKWVIFDEKIPAEMLFKLISAILLMQSIFLLGSIYFKKYSLVKTILTLTVICLFFAFIMTIEARYLVESKYEILRLRNEIDSIAIYEKIRNIRNIMSNIFFYLILPYFWLTSYIRLTEKEV